MDFYFLANISEFIYKLISYNEVFLCIVVSTSKKDVDIRRRELLEAISPAVLNYLNLHAEELVMDKATCVIVPAILKVVIGDVQPAMETIASLAAKEMVPGGKDGEVIVSDRGQKVEL